jgi:tRNA dimethylallyltransferase
MLIKVLKNKTVLRLLSRIKAGMINEVKNLHKNGVSWKRLESWSRVRQVALFLQNKITKQQMIDNLKNETWHFVKRQRTWFKRNKI